MNFSLIFIIYIVEKLIIQQKQSPSPQKTLKKLDVFYKKKSCPSILSSHKFLKKHEKTPAISTKPARFFKKPNKPLNKLQKNLSTTGFFPQSSQQKANKTFDFPSKDEEILYSMISKEYEALFYKPSTNLRKSTLPNLKDYLKSLKTLEETRFLRKSQEIRSKCSEISQKFDKNIALLRQRVEKQKKDAEIEEKACKIIQFSWRNFKKLQEKKRKTLKNVLNICHTELYKKNRAKLLAAREFSQKKPEKLRLLRRKPRDFSKKKVKNSKETAKIAGFSKNFDSFSSSKPKVSVNTTLNFKEINENSKSLITIHDFNSKSIERDEFSLKLTSSLHENLSKPEKFPQNLEKSPKNTEKSPKIDEICNEKLPERRGVSAKLLGFMELSQKLHEELNFIKREYFEKIEKKELTIAAEKFFSVILRQSELNRRILTENLLLTQAISPVSQEISKNCANSQENAAKSRLFEEDSFRNFTNRKLQELLKRDIFKEIEGARDNGAKKKRKTAENVRKRDKKGQEIEKWVDFKGKKQGNVKKVRLFNENFVRDVPKVRFFL